MKFMEQMPKDGYDTMKLHSYELCLNKRNFNSAWLIEL